MLRPAPGLENFRCRSGLQAEKRSRPSGISAREAPGQGAAVLIASRLALQMPIGRRLLPEFVGQFADAVDRDEILLTSCGRG